jgi:general secretion pathway protein C
LAAEWLSNTGDMSGRLGSGLQGVLQRLAQPENARRLRRGLLLLLGLWAAVALARLVWALFPEPQPLPPPEGELINPLVSEAPAAESASVDIQKMMNWHLFGKAGSQVVPELVTAPPETSQASALDGIEKGARETRLELLLRGVVASSEEGLGHAVIEYRKKQDIYAVEDKLPVGSKVKLAKVMPRQVVLDNNGKY